LFHFLIIPFCFLCKKENHAAIKTAAWRKKDLSLKNPLLERFYEKFIPQIAEKVNKNYAKRSEMRIRKSSSTV